MLRLVLLPLRAPMLLVLAAIAVYEGLHWSQPLEGAAASDMGQLSSLFWSLDCLHALLVVVVCTMPDLLLQHISSVMAASRVMSLVITLLIVTVGGLYVLHLKVLANVLILGTTVLLARLDLARVRVAPPPLLLATALCVLVLSGAAFGRWLASGA
ncbi:MAG: hypothetical protein VKK05_08160 [Synechococcus sp.]|jgi:hypothetical protein|nr:hypothetical protein [Synechococcus sp.]